MAVEPSPADLAERQLRQGCALLDRRLRAGERCLAEDLLREFPLVADQPDLAVELVYAEFVLREELGEGPQPEDYCRRFPRWEEPLRRLLGVHAALAHPTEDCSTSLGPIRAAPGDPDADPSDRPTQRLYDPGWPAPRGPDLPKAFGPYLLLAELGRGGMGVVYAARHLPLNRLVAVKMIGDGALVRPDQRARFRQEAEAIAQLNHPHIVQVYEVGEHEGRPFLALEYVDGGNLAQQVRRSLPPPRDAAAVVRVLAEAIQSAHERGVIHRDLKPANVLLQNASGNASGNDECRMTNDERMTNDQYPMTKEDSEGLRHSALGIGHSFVIRDSSFGIPKITDFGLACVVEAEADVLTRSGQLLGTPSYMAPEQVERPRTPITPATDVYGLGAILYELLTGRPPFLGTTVLDTLQQVLARDPVAPARFQPGCPRDLETIVLKCLSKEPARRYPRAADLADD